MIAARAHDRRGRRRTIPAGSRPRAATRSPGSMPDRPQACAPGAAPRGRRGPSSRAGTGRHAWPRETAPRHCGRRRARTSRPGWRPAPEVSSSLRHPLLGRTFVTPALADRCAPTAGGSVGAGPYISCRKVKGPRTMEEALASAVAARGRPGRARGRARLGPERPFRRTRTTPVIEETLGLADREALTLAGTYKGKLGRRRATGWPP